MGPFLFGGPDFPNPNPIFQVKTNNMNLLLSKFVSFWAGVFIGGSIYAACWVSYFFLYCTVLNGGNRQEWAAAGAGFFVYIGLYSGMFMGGVIALFTRKRSGAVEVACMITTACVALLLSDDFVGEGGAFQSLLFMSLAFHAAFAVAIGFAINKISQIAEEHLSGIEQPHRKHRRRRTKKFIPAQI